MLSDGKVANGDPAFKKLLRLLAPVFIFLFLLILIIVVLFAPALALEKAGKQLFAKLFCDGDETVINEDDMEAFWYVPQNVKDNLDEIFTMISNVNNGMTYVTKDDFNLILDKMIAYNSSVRQVDNAYRYYQHHYKIVISQTSWQTAAPDDTNTEVASISIPLPLPIRLICAVFNPVMVYADEIELQLLGEDEAADAATGEDAEGRLKWPCPGNTKITSKFGPRVAPTQGASTYHKGIDISCPTGSNVIASEAGVVVKADWQDPSDHSKGYGLEIVIQHTGGYYTRYAHLSAVNVSVGDTVTKGQVIAQSGNTGTSTGPHLHFEVRQGVNREAGALDPALFFDGSYDLSGPNEGVEDSGEQTQPPYVSDGVLTIAPTPDPVRKEVVIDTKEENGVTQELVAYYDVTDYEDWLQIGHIRNTSPENDSLFKVSWEEIYTMAAMASISGNAKSGNWETEVNLNAAKDYAQRQQEQTPESHTDDSTDNDNTDSTDSTGGESSVNIDGITRLDEATLNAIINDFSFEIGYHFDPTSSEQMPGTGDTYADHVYTYNEMEKYAYVVKEIGTNVEHGTEVFPPGTPTFDYYKKKEPVVAPAIATNAYMSIEYLYNENADGTATLAGRQVVIDGTKFYNYLNTYLDMEVSMDWYHDFICHLPGVNYVAPGSTGSIKDRFDKVYESYKTGAPVSYFDDSVPGVGEITLGTQCSRSTFTYTPRLDGDGNPINGNIGETQLNISLEDISDEQIKADIAAGLYTLEDLVYLASCIQAEAGSVDGQVAVAWCIRNRLPNYGSYKAVVTAPGQFASSWARYLNGSYSSQAQSVAAGVLRGDIANPIGNCYFFFSASSCWGHLPGVYYINVGGNMFYVNWGDVTQIVNRAGYVPF